MGERLSEGWGREAGRWGKRNEGKEAEEKGGVRECREEPVGRAGGIRKIRASGWRTARLVLVGLAGRRLNHSAKVSLRTVGFWNFGCALGSCCGWAFGLCVFRTCCSARAIGYIAQWLERLTADQQVPGSNPGVPFVAAAVTFCYSKFKAGFANIRPPGIEPGTI